MAAAAASRRHRVPPAMLLSKPMLVPMLLLLLGFIALASAGSVAKRPWKNSTSCDPDTHFVCRSDPKICIALSRVRDGSADCPDASDEACHRGEFRCLSNYFCIPERRVRDGWEDCPDGSDEICQKNEHRCRCGFPRCISVERVGDGVRDCLDGSDEDKEKGKAYKCPSDSSLQDLMAVERRRRSDSERRRRARHSGLMTYTVGLDHQAEAAEVSVALIEPTGALATLTRTEVNAEQTTLHTTEIRREYVEGTYSQILSTHSTVLELAPSLNEVEDSAQQEGRRQRPHTTHGVQSFGSLSSGKVFQTAVNELSSAVTTEVQPTRTTQASLLSALPGTKSTTVVGLNIKSGQISELSEEKDSEVPVITVTGTEGLLVQGTGSDHVTYKVFTGTYVNTEGHDAKTYMFFFGNRQLPVDATPSLPQEATRSEQFDIRSGNQKGVVLDISHKIGILLPSQTVSSISPTEAPRSDYLIFGSGSAHGGESMTGMLIEGSEPITIEGMTRSRMSTASTMHVTLSSMPAQSRREKTSSTTHKKATPTLYRHGKKFEPTATGRRIAPMDGATIITDKFFLPQHLGLYTTSPVSDTSRTADEFLEEVDHDYDTPPVREEEEDPVVMVRMRHPVNNFNIEAFRPELLTPTPVKDIRPTRTVGSNQDEYTDDAGDIFATDAFSDQDNEQNKSTKKNRVTLFGFVDFTTTISGTEVVFQPAATGTSFDFGNTRRPHEEDIYNPFNIPTRKPQTTSSSAKRKDSTYGTETREFVSKLSMLTSTFKGGVEMLSTMYTSTIPMLVKSRLPKYDDAELEGHVHSLAAEPNIGSSEYTEDYLYDSHVYENLVRSSSFSPEGLVTPNFLSSYLFPASKDQDVDSPISRTQERSSSVQPSETVMVSMIEGSKTEKYPVTPTRPALSTPTPKRKKTYKTGLVSSITGTDINGDMTTEWTTLIIGTVIGGRYAHVIQSTSSIFYTQSKTEMMEEVTTPKAPPPAPGLVLPSDIQIEGVSDRAVTEQELEEGTEAPAPATEETPQAESGEGAHDSLDVYSITSNFAVPLINQSRVVEDSYETALSGQEQPSVVELSDDLHVSTLVPSIEPSYTSPSSTSDVAVLTDGFILPSTQESTKEYDYDQPPTASASPEEDKPKIITMGFILPGADPASEFEDDLVHTDEVRLLTDGFVLPGQDLPSQLGNDQTQSTLQGRIIDTVVPPQQEAATVTSYPITHYSTFTYYTTLPGPSDSIVSSREVTTSQVFENSEEYEEARKHGFDTIAPEKSMLPLDPSQPATVMTTYTYQSTYTLDGSTLVSVSEKTMSDLLAPSEENVDSEKISPTATQVYLETSPGYDAASGTGQEDPHAQNPSESSETDDTTSSKATPPLEAAPTTYFTTYTYLTTLFKDGTSSVTSSLETVSNILYGSSSGSEDPVHDSLKKISPTSMVPVTTYYTTYTYFTTLLKDGTSTVTSREEIVSNTVRGSDATMTTQPSDLIEPTKTDLLSTVYTTYTYYTTFVRGGSTTIRNRTQVVSKVKTISQPSTTELITAPVVSTYYTTYTYFTTVNRGGTKSVKSRESVKTNVVTKYPKTAADQSTPVPSIITTYTTILSPVTVYRDGTPRVSFISKTSAITKTLTHSSTPTSEEAAESIIEATPTAGMHTMFTTYTYYTTFYEDGTPVISSREETVTNMISKPTGTPHLEETKRNLESSTIVRTYYTTYTYFTTFETDESPTVSSREEIVTNYVTMTPHDIITGVSPTSVSPEAQPTEASMTEETPPLLSSLPEGIDLRELLRNVPVTHYTTYTYYTTLYTDGSSVLSSRTEVVSNVVGPTAATAPTLPAGLEVDHSDLQSSVESTESTHISSSKAAESSSSEARSDTESIVADLAAQQSATPAPSPSFTPKLDSSFQKASSRFQKSPLKFRLRTPTFRSRTRLPPPTGAHITSALGAPLIVVRNKRNADPDDLAVAEARGDQIYATPVTYYTTFTYFTTYLKPDGRTSVASNLQVISSVHYPTQRIAPTRTIFHDQIHRTEPVRAYPSYQGVTGCIRCRSDIKTAYVTHTDYITEFFQGRPVTSTRYVTLTNYVTVTPGQTVYEHRPSQVIAVPGCIHCRQQPQYTTHTYYSTVLVAGRPVTSTRYDTVTNYVTVTVTEEPIHQRTRPTVVQPVVPHQPATAVDTFYTTYTYFTTSVIHGKPTVSTRYETLTNYVTRTRDDGVAGRAIQPTGAYRPVIIRPTPVRDTVYTTYTYFTTRLIHGRPTVETRYETVTDYVTVTVTEQARIRPTQVYRPLYSTVPGYAPHHTAYTTYTFYTTHYLDGRPVVDTRYETVTNVATVTLTEYATPAVGARVRPAETGPYRTYHTTYTYFTTRYVDGSAIVNTRKETVTNTVLGALCRTCPAGYVEGRSHDGGPHQQTAAITHTLAPGPQIQPTPTTYYTTYTHFTTILEGGRPVVQTRYETYTDIVSGIVLPTRALVAPEPSKQDLQQGHIQSRLDHVQDRVQEQLPVFQKIEPSRRRRSSLATRVPFAITDRGLAQAEYELVGGRGDTLSQVPRHRAQRGLSDDVNAPQARPGRKMLSHAFIGVAVDGSRQDEVPGGDRSEEVALFSSGIEPSLGRASSWSLAQSRSPHSAASESISDADEVTTISMGPITEVYEQLATDIPVLPKPTKGGSAKKWKAEKKPTAAPDVSPEDKYGIGRKFVSRKLQQFEETEDEGVRPAADFTRIRGRSRVRATRVQPLHLSTPEALVDNSGAHQPGFDNAGAVQDVPAEGVARTGVRRGRVFRRPVHRNRAILDDSSPNEFRGPHGGFIRRRPPHIVQDPVDLNPPQEPSSAFHFGDDHQAYSPGNLLETPLPALSSHHILPSPSLDNFLSSSFVGGGYSFSAPEVVATLTDPLASPPNHEITADAVALSGLETSALPQGRVRRIKVLRPAPHGEGSLGDGSKKVRRVTVTRTFSPAGAPTRYEDYRPQVDTPFNQDDGGFNHFGPHQNVVPVVQQQQRQQPQDVLRVPAEVTQQAGLGHGVPYDHFETGVNQQSFPGFSPNVPYQYSPPVPQQFAQAEPYSPRAPEQHDRFTQLQPVQNFVPVAEQPPGPPPAHDFNNVPLEVPVPPPPPPPQPEPVSPTRNSRRTVFRRIRPTNSNHHGERKTSLVRKTRPVVSTPAVQLSSFNIEPTHVFVSADSIDFNRVLGSSQQSLEYFGPASQEYFAPVSQEYFAPVSKEVFAPVSQQYFAPASDQYLSPVSRFPEPPPSLPPVSTEPTFDPHSAAPVEQNRENSADLVEDTTPASHQFRRIIRVKKPGEGKSGQRRKVVLNRRPSINSLQARGPINNGNNANELVPLSVAAPPPLSSQVLSPGQNIVSPRVSLEIGATVPLTYYTTFTYLTTFLHGTDTVYNSREAVLSSVATETLDSNIVNVIQNHGGFTTAPDGVSTVHLGSRTKGAATTIVNLESRLQIFNSDIYKEIHPTPIAQTETTFKTESPVLERIQEPQSPQHNAPGGEDTSTVQLTDLFTAPRTFYTLYTYYYTLFDGAETKNSVRSEISSSVAYDNSPFRPPIAQTKIRNGLLPLGLDVTTVHLGSRNVDGTTTEVNLGMRTVIKFDKIVDADIGQIPENVAPTASYYPSFATEAVDNKIDFISNQERSSLLADALQPSYAIASGDIQPTSNIHATPVILFPVDESTNAPRAKVRIVTSRVKSAGSLKSGVFQAAPGVRVRIKPVVKHLEDSAAYSAPPELSSTRAYEPFSSFFITSPNPSTELTGDEPLLSSAIFPLTTPEDQEVHRGKKRLKVTLRRPIPGDKLARTNSLNTRFVRPSRFEITTKPRFYVVTRTNAAGVARPTKNPFNVKVSKRLKPTDLIRATPSVIYETFTTTTSVPVIFGLQTSYKEVVITASTPVTLTASPTYGVDDHDLIEPSQTVMLTYFTTTTFTVPYTLGDQTLYTTVLETNSRVVTETVAASRVVNALHASHFPEIIGDQNAQLIGRGAAPKHESSLNLLASHYQQRPGLSTRVSDGVTLIVASGGDGEATTHLFPHQPTPYTLQPTLLLDAVLMKEHFDGHNVSPQPYSVSYSTKTLFTTYTYFTTFFTDDSSSIASSEQVISNTVTIPVTQNLYPTITPYLPEPREPSTYLETSERVVTSTSYNTFTFYATLFNGSSSVVTPFEEVQSQVFVITESFTITRTVQPTLSIQPQSTPVFSRPEPQQSYYYPDQDQYLSQHYSSQQPQLYQANDILKSQQLQPSTVLSTLYSTQTNFITFFQGTSTIVTSIEEVLSDVVTITIPHGLATPVLSSPHSPSPTTSVPEFSTRTYLTTQTQYVTFFRGTETILSSIEEIGTTVVTERAGSRPSVYSRPISTPALHSFAPAASSTPSFVLPSHTGAQADLVPSVRTYYTTYTYFTTFYTDSSSIIASRENVVTSHVTLFVPRGSLTSSVRTTAPTRIPTVATHTTSSTSASTRPTTTSTSRYTRPTSTTPPYDTKLYTTGTTYTTYTFYTTLFGGQDKIVISSEQVVPQIVTTRIGSKPSTTSSRYRLTPTVLTHMTTYTYFTTLVSDSETIVSSSEEVITQFVSTTISPSSSTSFVPEVNIITSSLYKPVKEEKVEPSSKTGTSHSKRPSLGSGFKRPSTGFHQKSSVTLFASSSFIPSSSPTLTTVTPAFTILESPSIEEESTRSSMGVSTTVIDGSTVIFFTDIAASQEEETDSIGSDSVSSLFTSSMLSPVFVPSSSLFPEILESSFFSSPSVAAPVTSTTVLESSSKYVGHDNETTTLPPSITLFMVTGTDGSLTRLTEATFTSRTQNVVPSKAAGPAVADIVATEIPYLEQAPSASSPSSGAGGSQVGTSSPSKPIKPGSIIDLADVLGGNANIGGNIGEAIKGIVHLLSNGKKNGTDGTSELQPSQVKEDVPLPPSDGVTVSNIEEPVYIPVGAIASDMPAAERSQVHSESFDGPALTSILHGKPSIMGEGFHTDVFTGAETVFILPTDSHYDDDAADGEDVPERVDKDTSVHLVGSVKKASLPSTDATPALDANTGVITGDKTIFFDDFDKFTELTQRAEDSKGDATISDPKELSKVVGVQTIFFPDTNVLQSSLASEVQITGATTIFGEGFTPILPGTQDSSETLVSSIQPTVVGGAKSVSGATTIFFQLDGERVPILPSVSTSLSTVTQYVTSVESFTRTLTLTTTKVYYTRDSPLTITSVFTTTIAPRTFVSTIIGSRTILGTLPEPSASVEAQLTTPLPSEATTTVTTTTLIFNSITTTVVRTLVLPTERPEPTRSSSIGNLPTTSVLVTPEVRGRTPESADSKSPPTLRPPQRRLTTPRTTTAAHGKRPVIAFRAPSRTPDTASTKPMPTGPKFKIPFPKPPTTTTTTPKPSRPPKSKPGKVTPIDGYPPVCLPGCNTANYEVCRETLDGTWQCTCKPGYGRQDGNKTCTEVETYVVILRVVKMGESAVSYSTELSNSLSTEFQQIADAAKKGMSDAYKKTDVESQFVTSNLNSISAADDLDTADSAPQGILLNFTVSMARSEAITSEVIREQLTRSLRQSNYSIGKSPLFVSPNVHAVAAVQDYDECGDFDANDCDRFSVCVNLPGTYTCYCKSGFEDLDPLRPGRVCSGEIKNCDHCNGRGTCLVNDDGKRSCRCNRMFLGRRCEINGLVLAIALPIALALLVMMLCCLVCLCRRWKRRAQRAKGPFRLGAVSPLGGTLDKKAMITDTSSESSGEHALKHSYAFDGFMVGPGPGKPQSSGAIDTLGRDQVDMGTMQSKLLYVLDGSTGNARQPTDSKSDEGRFASLPDTNTFNRWKSSQTKEESAGAKKKGSKKSSPASSEKKASPPATGTAQRRPDAPAPPPPPPPAPITPGTSRWLDSSKRAAERQHLVHQKQQQQQRGHSGDDAPSQPSTFSREMDKFRSSVAGPSDAGPQQPQQQQQQQGEDAYGTNTFTKKSTISETGRSYDETTIRPAVKRLRPPDAPDDDAVPSTSRGGGGADFGEENSRFDDSGNDVAPSASPIQVVRADASRTRRTSKSGSSTGDSDVVARPF
ncbi:mucin-17-like isoform X3 [Dermacentor albipictus]|uniref:mucin-17-like isoform X3 n=1 Tax=Dermacentor albipictus TaxID=60249 RepID=UPI0031FC065F